MAPIKAVSKAGAGQGSANGTTRFMRALIAGGEGRRAAQWFVVSLADGSRARLAAQQVRLLQSQGALAGDAHGCRATPETRAWLKRQMLEAGQFAAQHRIEGKTPDGAVLNLAESPLARLAVAYLTPWQVAAGEKVRHLVHRAQLEQRVTLSYDPAHIAGSSRNGAVDMADSAAEARRALGELHRILPADCAGVVLDICGFLKGLQEVETERGWPRRSAKLVLRIGLDQLASHYGLAPQPAAFRGRGRYWMQAGARAT